MWSAVPHPQPLLPLLPWGVTLALALWAALAESQGKSVSRAALFAASAAGLGFGWISGGLPGLADAIVASMALAAPFALLLLITGFGPALLLGIVNAWLIGRDLEEMVWLRHRKDDAELCPIGKWNRFALGGAIAALLLVPFVNFIAPVLGAAAATHLIHRRP